MKAVVDSMGRVVIPKAMRDELGLTPGAPIDISEYGGGVYIEPGTSAAGDVKLLREGKYLVIDGDGELRDEEMYRIIDRGRR